MISVWKLTWYAHHHHYIHCLCGLSASDPNHHLHLHRNRSKANMYYCTIVLYCRFLGRKEMLKIFWLMIFLIITEIIDEWFEWWYGKILSVLLWLWGLWVKIQIKHLLGFHGPKSARTWLKLIVIEWMEGALLVVGQGRAGLVFQADNYYDFPGMPAQVWVQRGRRGNSCVDSRCQGPTYTQSRLYWSEEQIQDGGGQ